MAKEIQSRKVAPACRLESRHAMQPTCELEAVRARRWDRETSTSKSSLYHGSLRRKNG